MKYYSLNNNSKDVGFIEAIERGLAPDRGLYFPSEIPELSNYFVNNIKKYSDHEIAFQVIKPFVGNEIPNDVLKTIIKKTLKFNFPIVNISKNIASLELFHGPTFAFKDVGARFMANCLYYANRKEKENKKITVLVATSGDTGGAVANGFYKFKNIDVVILFPKGKVSEIQEYQLTTLGKNITALEVEGSFDDCQNFVKNAFIDPELIKKIKSNKKNIFVIGPLPSIPHKVKGNARNHLIIKCNTKSYLNRFLKFLTNEIQSWPETKKVKWSYDIDPYNMS